MVDLHILRQPKTFLAQVQWAGIVEALGLIAKSGVDLGVFSRGRWSHFQETL
jgi:hypothetical protein